MGDNEAHNPPLSLPLSPTLYYSVLATPQGTTFQSGQNKATCMLAASIPIEPDQHGAFSCAYLSMCRKPCVKDGPHAVFHCICGSQIFMHMQGSLHCSCQPDEHAVTSHKYPVGGPRKWQPDVYDILQFRLLWHSAHDLKADLPHWNFYTLQLQRSPIRYKQLLQMSTNGQ